MGGVEAIPLLGFSLGHIGNLLIEMVLAAALGQLWFAVENVNGDVVGGVLLRSLVADGSAIGGGTLDGEIQCAKHGCCG